MSIIRYLIKLFDVFFNDAVFSSSIITLQQQHTQAYTHTFLLVGTRLPTGAMGNGPMIANAIGHLQSHSPLSWSVCLSCDRHSNRIYLAVSRSLVLSFSLLFHLYINSLFIAAMPSSLHLTLTSPNTHTHTHTPVTIVASLFCI